MQTSEIKVCLEAAGTFAGALAFAAAESRQEALAYSRLFGVRDLAPGPWESLTRAEVRAVLLRFCRRGVAILEGVR